MGMKRGQGPSQMATNHRLIPLTTAYRAHPTFRNGSFRFGTGKCLNS